MRVKITPNTEILEQLENIDAGVAEFVLIYEHDGQFKIGDLSSLAIPSRAINATSVPLQQGKGKILQAVIEFKQKFDY